MPARPFDETLVNSLGSLLSLVELPAPGAKQVLLVEPVIDGGSGVHSMATRRIESRLVDLARKKYPHFAVQPFSPKQLEKSPVVLFGTLTAVNPAGYPEGKREAYRICLALADLKSGRMLSKEVAKAQLKSVNHAPSPYFIDSPGWISERSTEIRAQACEASQPGDILPARYLDGIVLGATVNEAIALYEGGRYTQALESYTRAAASSHGGDLLIYNGLYLANLKLGRSDAAAAALAKIIEIGMAAERFALNFQFKPGSTNFPADKRIYQSWLREIARRAAHNSVCLEVVGHTSPSGSEASNEKLSFQRAESIKKALEAEVSDLVGRLTARGAGSRENLVGTGMDDLSDSLDRRITFSVISCPRTETQTAHR